jgi:hypothetical protein
MEALLKVLFPTEISNHFEVKEVNDYPDRIEIRLDEYQELVPPQMTEQRPIVLDGFCNPIELQTFMIKGKATFLKIYRRRWKYQGQDKHYSNTYQLNPEGVKATNEFASFLKDNLGLTPDQHLAFVRRVSDRMR